MAARANTLAQWHGQTAFTSLQAPYNLLRRDIERELLPMAEAMNMTLAAWSPLADGILSGKFARPAGEPGVELGTRVDPASISAHQRALAETVQVVAELGATSAQVAIGWTHARSPAIHPIIGARRLGQLEDNLGAADLDLPAEALARLETATQIDLGFPRPSSVTTVPGSSARQRSRADSGGARNLCVRETTEVETLNNTGEVRELRLVVTAPDYDEALRFYRDVLVLPERAAYASPGGRGTILEAGRATLELADPPHAAYIDDVEVGRRVAGHIRVAFEVDDAAEATSRLAGAGATVIADPVPTLWQSLNARLDAPGGLQLTLFSDLGRGGAGWSRPDQPAQLVLDQLVAVGDQTVLGLDVVVDYLFGNLGFTCHIDDRGGVPGPYR